MKYYLFLILFFASRMLAFGEISDKELKYLEKSVQIAGTRDYTKKNEDRKKIEIFQVNTFQNQDDMFPYRIRIAVELKDREENVYVASFTGEPSGDYDSEYEGEDYWELYMPYEDLEGLKVTAYAVQYGVMDGDQFVILAEEEKNYEKLLKGLNDRTTLVFPNSIALMHYYMYEDSSEGSTESTPRKVKAVK